MRRVPATLVSCVLALTVAGQEVALPKDAAEPTPDPSDPEERPLDEQDLRERWLGRHRDEVIAAWGVPTRIKQQKASEVLIYKNLFYCGIVVRSSEEHIEYSRPATSPTDVAAEESADHYKVSDHQPWPEPTIKWDKTKVVFRFDSAGHVEDLQLSLPNAKKRKKCMTLGEDPSAKR